MFDKEAFLATAVEAQMETKFTPPPEGDYRAFIKDIDTAEIKNQPVLVIIYQFTDDSVKELMGTDEPTVKDNIFLDFENGRLAIGKNRNIKLGALREAVGQNTGAPWSATMLRGAGPVMLKIMHRMDKDGNGPFANVARVTACK